MATWKELLTGHMAYYGETLEDTIFSTLSPDELVREFDDGFGLPEGKPFYIWTEKRVYFAKEYDGAESVGSVPRFPCKEEPFHH
jgi:hypothetical protein